MHYIFAIILGFLLVGAFFGLMILVQRKLVREEGMLSYLCPLIASFVPTVMILWWKNDFSLHLENMRYGRYWMIIFVGTSVVCAFILAFRKKENEGCSGRTLILKCVEAGTMEIPQRLMAQSFIFMLLSVWGRNTIYCIPINALVWCLGICVQGVLIRQERRELIVDLIASALFSMAAGYVFYQTGCIVYCVIAHMLERFVTTPKAVKLRFVK